MPVRIFSNAFPSINKDDRCVTFKSIAYNVIPGRKVTDAPPSHVIDYDIRDTHRDYLRYSPIDVLLSQPLVDERCFVQYIPVNCTNLRHASSAVDHLSIDLLTMNRGT